MRPQASDLSPIGHIGLPAALWHKSQCLDGRWQHSQAQRLGVEVEAEGGEVAFLPLEGDCPPPPTTLAAAL